MTDFHPGIRPVFTHRETGVRYRLVAQPSTGHRVSVGGVLATLDNATSVEVSAQQLERDFELATPGAWT